MREGKVVYRYIELEDPDGMRDADRNINARNWRGQAVICVLRPELYHYDPGYAFVPHTLLKTLRRAHEDDELLQAGVDKYVLIETRGEPLYLIQKIHLTRKRKRQFPDQGIRPRKRRCTFAAF